MRQIEPWAADILGRSTFKERASAYPVLVLPEQLPRPEYEKIAKVLKGLGGKWTRNVGGHVFPFDPRDLVAKAVDTGAYTDRKQDLQLFETPAPLAERMARLSWAGPGKHVLEPSAGLGRLVIPVLACGADVTAIELDETNVKALKDLVCYGSDRMTIFRMAFEDIASIGTVKYDAVVMNPPFTRGQDADHIMAAWECLKPSGRLVAICSEGPFFRSDRRSVAFRDWIAEAGIETEKLPIDTFRESGTGVATRLLKGTKSRGETPGIQLAMF